MTRPQPQTTPAEPILSVRDLTVQFRVASRRGWPWSDPAIVHAVNGVSFDIPRGQTLGIVGESGCGKSTLIRAIAGLVPATAGQVRLEGRDIDYRKAADLAFLRRRVQMIFQDPVASLNPRMTLREIVAEPISVFFPERPAQAREAQVHALLDRVGIARRNANRYPHEFSGGQCQRIGIARALAARPQILLCDEPVSALDVSIQAQVIELLNDLQQEMGVTLAFVAHDLGVVSHISDDIMVLYLGATMEQGPAKEIIAAPAHPYSRALLSAVPVPDPNRQITPEVLAGDLPSPLRPPPGCPFETRCPRAQPDCAKTRPSLVSLGEGAGGGAGAGGRQLACLHPIQG